MPDPYKSKSSNCPLKKIITLSKILRIVFIFAKVRVTMLINKSISFFDTDFTNKLKQSINSL